MQMAKYIDQKLELINQPVYVTQTLNLLLHINIGCTGRQLVSEFFNKTLNCM